MNCSKDQNLSRPDGYNLSEKLMSWARMGWWHSLIFFFVAFCIAAVGSVSKGNMLYLNGIIQGTYNILDDFDLASWYKRFIDEFGLYILTVLFVVLGLLANRISRYAMLMGALALTLSLSPLTWVETHENAFTFGYLAVVVMGLSLISVAAYIYCYEWTPIKWRAPVVIAMATFETLGMFTVALVTSFLIDSFKGDEEELQQFKDNLWKTINLSVLLPAALAFVIGLAIRADTPFSQIVRGFPGAVYDRLRNLGQANTSEPIPVSREEFVEVTQQEAALSMSLKENLVSAVGPLCIICLSYLALGLSDRAFKEYYEYQFQSILGDQYYYNFLPSIITEHCVSLGGLVVTIGGWWVWKDIRFVPATALLAIAIGALVCSTVEVVYPNMDGYPYYFKDLSSPNTVVVGYIAVLLGVTVVKATMRVLAMDLFTNSNRLQGMLILKAVELLCIALGNAWTLATINYSWCFVIIAAIIAIVSGVVFGAFYLTKWFDHSLICRDPETDACWLVPEKFSLRYSSSTGIGSSSRGRTVPGFAS